MSDNNNKLAALQTATAEAADADANATANNNNNNNNTTIDDTASDMSRSTTMFKMEKLAELDDKFGPLFDGSVYHDLLYYTHTKSKSALVFGIVVWIFQMYLYILFFGEATTLINEDLYNVQLSYANCWEDGSDIESVNLTCSVGEIPGFFESLAPAILLSAFLFADIMSILKVLVFLSVKDIGYWAKIVAVLLLINTSCALYAGCLFAFQGQWQGSQYDSVINCVGVLFVADMDEKVQDGLQYINKDDLCKCCKGFLKTHAKLLFFLSWFAVCAVMGQIVSSAVAPY